MDERYKNTNGSLAVNKEQLVDDFYQRLVESYGYSRSQIARRVSISDRSDAVIAIWRSEDEKVQGLTPNIYVLVACRAEHIRIEALEGQNQSKKVRRV